MQYRDGEDSRLGAPLFELQDKADIQKLLALPNLEIDTIKKYADLFREWTVIEKLRGIKS